MAITPAKTPKTPWHLWVVGVLYLLWSCMGALDFTMTQTHNATYAKGFTAAQLSYFYSFPLWVVIVWAISTWGGLVASLLLLLRKRVAVPLFLAAFVATVLTTIYNYVLSDGMKIMGGTGALIFCAIILIAGLLVWLYARAMRRKGVLR